MDRYIPIALEKKEENIKGMSRLIDNFLELNQYNANDVKVNAIALSRIVDKVHQREKYFSYFHNISMSELKQIALNCFWIIKLHPIDMADGLSKEEQSKLKSINENFAIYYMIAYLKVLYKEKNNDVNTFFDSLYIKELMYSFTYRDISKEAMILLVETIAKGIGIQPYKEDEIKVSE